MVILSNTFKKKKTEVLYLIWNFSCLTEILMIKYNFHLNFNLKK